MVIMCYKAVIYVTQSCKTRNKSQDMFLSKLPYKVTSPNYFQTLKFVFSCLLSGEQMYPFKRLKESIQMRYF